MFFTDYTSGKTKQSALRDAKIPQTEYKASGNGKYAFTAFAETIDEQFELAEKSAGGMSADLLLSRTSAELTLVQGLSASTRASSAE